MMRATQQQKWISWSTEIENEVSTYQDKYDKALEDTEPATEIEAQVTAKKTLFTSKRNSVDSGLTTVSAELDKLDMEREVPKAKYIFLKTTLDRYTHMLRVEMEEIINSLLKMSPATAPDTVKLQEDNVPALQVSLQNLELRMSELKVSDATFMASSANNTWSSADLFNNSQSTIGPAVQALTARGKNPYSYARDELPTFNGDVANYPSFLNEWTDSVQPGMSDAWILRNLQKSTPREDDLTIYKTPAEAWTALSSKYANPISVSNTLMTQYMAKSSIDGVNDQQKLTNLHFLLKKLYQRLETVDEQHQLTENMAAISHAIKLMPEKYGEELANIRDQKKTEHFL